MLLQGPPYRLDLLAQVLHNPTELRMMAWDKELYAAVNLGWIARIGVSEYDVGGVPMSHVDTDPPQNQIEPRETFISVLLKEEDRSTIRRVLVHWASLLTLC